jgi:hypothetical protein
MSLGCGTADHSGSGRDALMFHSALLSYCWPLAFTDYKNGSRRLAGFRKGVSRHADSLRVHRSIRGGKNATAHFVIRDAAPGCPFRLI